MKSDLPVPALVLASLPIVIVAAILIITIIFLPKDNQDIRSSASAPLTATPTTIPIITSNNSPETACSSLYSPVCGVNGLTYLNACEAAKASVQVAIAQECAKTSTTTTPSSSPSSQLLPQL